MTGFCGAPGAGSGPFLAALPVDWYSILPLALLSVLLVLLVIKAFRERADILDVEDPDTPEDLLRSFEHAHRAGELDDDEFERVKRRLGLSTEHSDPHDPTAAAGPVPLPTSEHGGDEKHPTSDHQGDHT